MALFGNYQGKDAVRPVQDANGVFQRTNTSLEVSDGIAPAQKWLVDNRLPVSFVYGFAAGVNQMVLGKGLVVSVDPLKYQKDFETQKMHSVLTVANGGKDVVLDGTGKTWVEGTYVEGNLSRPANKPIGVLFSNIMKKVDDQFNGMAPTVITEKYIKLPLFSDAAHALLNPWGSAYGTILPGDSVKSDLNGRFVKWTPETITVEQTTGAVTVTGDSVEQKVGQVLAIAKDLVPEGAAVWATWALGDRENSDYFNPMEGVEANNLGYPGYPYDKSHGYNELNKTNPRMPAEFDIARGIPGLTDGSRVASQVVADQVIDLIPLKLATYTQARYCRTLENGTQIGGIKFTVKTTLANGQVKLGTAMAIDGATATGSLKIDIGAGEVAFAHIDYSDALAGLGVVVIDNAAPLANATNLIAKVEIVASYNKKGLAGVPTMLDWDGVLGEIRILIDK